jgi:hypothetical protein
MPKPEGDEKQGPIKLGTLRGKIWIADNFDDPLPDDVLDEFESGGGPLSLKPDNGRRTGPSE